MEKVAEGNPLLGLVAQIAGFGNPVSIGGTPIGTILPQLLSGQLDQSQQQYIAKQMDNFVAANYAKNTNALLHQDLVRQRQALAYKLGTQFFKLSPEIAKQQALSNVSLPGLAATAYFLAPGVDLYKSVNKLSSLIPRQTTPQSAPQAERITAFSRTALRYILAEKGARAATNLNNDELTDLITHLYKKGTFSNFIYGGGNFDEAGLRNSFAQVSRLGDVAKQLSPNLAEGIELIEQAMGPDYLINPKKLNSTVKSLQELVGLATLTGDNPVEALREAGQATQGRSDISSSKILNTYKNHLRVKASLSRGAGVTLDDTTSQYITDRLHDLPESELSYVAGAGYSEFLQRYGKDRANSLMKELLSDKKVTNANQLLSAINRRFGYGERGLTMEDVRDRTLDETANRFRHSPGFAMYALKGDAVNVPEQMLKKIESRLSGPLAPEARQRFKTMLSGTTDYDAAVKKFVNSQYSPEIARRRHREYTEALGNVKQYGVASAFSNDKVLRAFENIGTEILPVTSKYNVGDVPNVGIRGITQELQKKDTNLSMSDLIKAFTGWGSSTGMQYDLNSNDGTLTTKTKA